MVIDRLKEDQAKMAVWGLLFVLAHVVCWWMYSPVLQGPLFLDSIKLGVIENHILAQRGCFSVPEFPSFLGRKISMYSLCLDILRAPEVWSYEVKQTNLILHHVNAVLVFFLVWQIALKRHVLNPIGFAAVVAIMWLLSPFHYATVPYAIQRMAILCGTFSLLSMLAFIYSFAGRTLLRLMMRVSALVFLWLAIHSKENGILTVGYIGVIYIFIVRPVTIKPKVVLFAAASTCLVLMFVVAGMNGMLDYSNTDGDLSQRLLTQTRVIGYYVLEILLPVTGDIGLLNDDIILSETLFAPISTFVCALFIAGCLAIAIFQNSLIAFGIMFFFVGHLLESTAFPLEMVFLHRNYLPAIGVILSALFVFWRIPSFYKHILVVLLLLLYCWVGSIRGGSWKTHYDVYSNAYYYHPGSLRSASGYAQALIEKGRISEAVSVLDGFNETRLIASVTLQVMYARCISGKTVENERYEELALGRLSGPKEQLFQALENVLLVREKINCDSLSLGLMASSVESLLEKLVTDGVATSWEHLYFKARVYESFSKNEQLERVLLDALNNGEIRAGFYLRDFYNANSLQDKAEKLSERLPRT